MLFSQESKYHTKKKKKTQLLTFLFFPTLSLPTKQSKNKSFRAPHVNLKKNKKERKNRD
jgi:hypothetical protein